MTRLRLPYTVIGMLMISLTVITPLWAEGEPPPAPVRVIEARQQAIAPSNWVFGSIYSRHQANIAAEVTGRLLSVAEVGDIVKRGDILARIDASAIQLQYDELRAQITS